MLATDRKNIMATNKIIKHQKENGIFLFFIDYENEDDFPEFLEMLKIKLGANVKNVEVIVYCIAAQIIINNVEVIGFFRDDVGCYLKLDVNETSFADEIIAKCS